MVSGEDNVEKYPCIQQEKYFMTAFKIRYNYQHNKAEIVTEQKTMTVSDATGRGGAYFYYFIYSLFVCSQPRARALQSVRKMKKKTHKVI